jgi:hypothetical protein
VTAEILMHLAEIEERRLHLRAGYNSLFSYCLGVHGMSEDEACRRIEVARLGRRFNSIFGLVASGALSLSVAALLKDSLTADNQSSLFAALAGKSVRAAREELAALFPMSDAPATIRKLPTSKFTRDIAGAMPVASAAVASAAVASAAVASAAVASAAVASAAGSVTFDHAPNEPSNRARETTGPSGSSAGVLASDPAAGSSARVLADDAVAGSSARVLADDAVAGLSAQVLAEDAVAGSSGRVFTSDPAAIPTASGGELVTGKRQVVKVETPRPFGVTPSLSRGDRVRVEPIAAGRYRVQFTANREQRQKLELALDLMSHQNPRRDLAATVERGLDLLIEALLRARMGKTSRPRAARKSAR